MKNTNTITGAEYKNIRIDYYSGTGGTELAAKLLADKLKNENRTILWTKNFEF